MTDRGQQKRKETRQLRSRGLPEDIMLPQVKKRGEPHIQQQTFVASINRPLTVEELTAIYQEWFDLSEDSEAVIGTTVRVAQPLQSPQRAVPPPTAAQKLSTAAQQSARKITRISRLEHIPCAGKEISGRS